MFFVKMVALAMLALVVSMPVSAARVIGQDDCPETKAAPFAPYQMGNSYSKEELIALLKSDPQKMAWGKRALRSSFDREVTDVMVIDAINAAQVVKAVWSEGDITTYGVCPNGGLKEITRDPYTHTSGSTEDALVFQGRYIWSLWCLNPIVDLRDRDDGMRETAPVYEPPARVEYRDRPVYVDRPVYQPPQMVYVQQEPIVVHEEEIYGGSSGIVEAGLLAYGYSQGGDRYYDNSSTIIDSFNRTDNRRWIDKRQNYGNRYQIDNSNDYRQWNDNRRWTTERPRHEYPRPRPGCQSCGGGGHPYEPPNGPPPCDNCGGGGGPRNSPNGDYGGRPVNAPNGPYNSPNGWQ